MFARMVGWFRSPRSSLGERGEQAAARHLRRLGYRILDRHLRTPQGEIDLLATDGRRLVFVEVKTRRSASYEHPAEAVDAQKQRRLAGTARAYMQRHRLGSTPARFDVIAVIWPAGAKRPTIEHFPGAFEPPEE